MNRRHTSIRGGGGHALWWSRHPLPLKGLQPVEEAGTFPKRLQPWMSLCWSRYTPEGNVASGEPTMEKKKRVTRKEEQMGTSCPQPPVLPFTSLKGLRVTCDDNKGSMKIFGLKLNLEKMEKRCFPQVCKHLLFFPIT